MVILQCPTCDFATADVEAVGAAAILQIHDQDHQAQPAVNSDWLKMKY